MKPMSRTVRTVLYAVILISLLLVLVIGPLRDPNRTSPQVLEPPGKEHWLGTDSLGRDVAARLIAAARFDLLIVASSVLLAFWAGLIVGTILGFSHESVDFVGMRFLEIFQAIPALLLGLLVLTALGPGVFNLIGVIVLLNIPIYARLVRAELLAKRRSPLVDAARISGVSWPKTIILYVLPSSLTSALAYIPSQAGFAVILVAGLGFLGLGVPLPQAELGDMIRQGTSDIMIGVWWTGLFPSLVLIAATLSFYRLGDWLLKLAGLDPRAKELADAG